MTPITGPATLLRRIAKILATARRARRPLCVPTTIDGDRLFAYWENTLDADARREVEDQARVCEECRRWLEEIGKMFGERDVLNALDFGRAAHRAAESTEEEYGMNRAKNLGLR